MRWFDHASIWQLLAAAHLFLMMAVFLGSLVAALVRHLTRSPVQVTRDDLAISVLKPLKGLDPALEANLESYARLDAAESYEVLLLVEDTNDEALPIARAVAERHPGRVRVIIGTTPGVPNPKVAALIHALPHARNPLLWVTDSNTETSNEHLQAHVAEWKALQAKGRRPTLIHASVAGVGGSGLGARFERLHLATYNSLGEETSLVAGIDAVVGKSLLFHRDDLAAVGGLESFGSASGEDYLMGRAFHRAGAVRLARRATRQVLAEDLAGIAFWQRQARWARCRRGMIPFAFIVLEPFTYFALPMLWLALGLLPWQVVALALAVKSVGDALLLDAVVGEVRLGDLVLLPLKEVVLLTAWASGFFTQEVTWRGRRIPMKSKGEFGPAQDQAVVEFEESAPPHHADPRFDN